MAGRVKPKAISNRIVRPAAEALPRPHRLDGDPREGHEVVDYRLDTALVVEVGYEETVREVRRASSGSTLTSGLTSCFSGLGPLRCQGNFKRRGTAQGS